MNAHRAPPRREGAVRPVHWSNLVPSLERGDFDIVMNGLEATAERARADPAVGAVLHLRRDAHGPRRRARISSLADLDGQARRHAQPDVRARPAARAAARAGALRGQRGAVHRSRARPHRRGAARQHHRRSLRLHPTRPTLHVRARRRRARHVRDRHPQGRRRAQARRSTTRSPRCARTASSSRS